MKKITLFAVALIAVSFASCVKTHTCKCVDSNGNSTSYSLPRQTSSAAKVSCDSYAYSGTTCSIQ
jgi:hypothetical protein